jgi:hypothetical protein
MIGIDPSFIFGGDIYLSYKTDFTKNIIAGGGFEKTQTYEDIPFDGLDSQYTSLFIEAEYWVNEVFNQGFSFGMFINHIDAKFNYEFANGDKAEDSYSQIFPQLTVNYNWMYGNLIFTLGWMQSLVEQKTIEFDNGSEGVSSSTPLPISGPRIGLVFRF